MDSYERGGYELPQFIKLRLISQAGLLGIPRRTLHAGLARLKRAGVIEYNGELYGAEMKTIRITWRYYRPTTVVHYVSNEEVLGKCEEIIKMLQQMNAPVFYPVKEASDVE